MILLSFLCISVIDPVRCSVRFCNGSSVLISDFSLKCQNMNEIVGKCCLKGKFLHCWKEYEIRLESLLSSYNKQLK